MNNLVPKKKFDAMEKNARRMAAILGNMNTTSDGCVAMPDPGKSGSGYCDDCLAADYCPGSPTRTLSIPRANVVR